VSTAVVKEGLAKVVNELERLKREIRRYAVESDAMLRNLYYGKTSLSDVGNFLGRTTALLENLNKELTSIQKELLKIKGATEGEGGG